MVCILYFDIYFAEKFIHFNLSVQILFGTTVQCDSAVFSERVCVCVRTASCSSLCPEVCFPPLLALLSTDQKESSLVWFLEQSAPPRHCPSFLPHYKAQKNAWKREDGQLYFGEKKREEWFEADIKVLFQQRCMWDGASAGGIFPLQGVSGPDVTLMSCSKLRCSGGGQLAVVCVLVS